jgi:hypothetical protein
MSCPRHLLSKLHRGSTRNICVAFGADEFPLPALESEGNMCRQLAEASGETRDTSNERPLDELCPCKRDDRLPQSL